MFHVPCFLFSFLCVFSVCFSPCSLILLKHPTATPLSPSCSTNLDSASFICLFVTLLHFFFYPPNYYYCCCCFLARYYRIFFVNISKSSYAVFTFVYNVQCPFWSILALIGQDYAITLSSGFTVTPVGIREAHCP